MALDFNTLLTADQKREVLQQRITQFATEAYQHEMNRQTAIALGDAEFQAQSEQALATLTAAIETHQTQLDAL